MSDRRRTDPLEDWFLADLERVTKEFLRGEPGAAENYKKAWTYAMDRLALVHEVQDLRARVRDVDAPKPCRI